MVLAQTKSRFADALVADGRDPEHADALMLFGRFVGEWDFDWAGYNPDEQEVATESGEWIFGWVLGGRAVQDVWIIPSRERSSELGLPTGEYGTTIRVYDPAEDAWLVTWNGPLGRARRTFVARPSGDSIVQEGRTEEGDQLRWIFSEIEEGSFTWRSLSSGDDGKTWVSVRRCTFGVDPRRNAQTGFVVLEAVSAEVSRLAKTPLVEGPGFALETVECGCSQSGWSSPEQVARYGIVFVRRGCFRRRLNVVDSFVDPTVLYFERPDDEQQIAHPSGGGDSCTALYLSGSMLARLWGGEPGLPDEPLASDPETDLRQRLLLAAVMRRDEADVAAAVVGLAAAVLERSESRRVASGRPSTLLSRQRTVAAAREALAENPRAGVVELAKRVAVSPHHLSRVFKSETGETISRYRNRLRVRLALERLAAGEPCLARLAAELGFADQAHLARVVRQELGSAPSLLRERLATA